MSYENTEDVPCSSYVPAVVVFSILVCTVCVWDCVFIVADWIKVSGAVKATDLFILIPGYLLRQAQATNPSEALRGPQKKCD